jgi:hypothetical protein
MKECGVESCDSEDEPIESLKRTPRFYEFPDFITARNLLNGLATVYFWKRMSVMQRVHLSVRSCCGKNI